MPWVRCALLLALTALAGCRRSEVAETTPVDPAIRLGDHIDISLADWLNKPREELARLADEMAGNIEKQQDFGRSNAGGADLLPGLHAPVTVPVFTQCRYSPAAGLSLPPYVKDGSRDAAVALHLARHGDREAALKLADAADTALLSEIDAWRTDRNYPAEWTRLVGLTLQSAQFKLAHGQVEGATELVLLHRQLHEVLDARAVKGPLGAALLGLGRTALQKAAAAWRDAKVKQPNLVEDVEAAVAAWGEVPALVPGLASHARKDEVARVFGGPAQGRTVAAATPEAILRAFDLLAVPLPTEGAQAVVAFLDGRDRLDEVLLVYRSKINEAFPEPAHLAFHLVECGFTAAAPASSPGQLRQTFEAGNLNCDVDLFTLSHAAGAVVHVGAPGRTEEKAAVAFARDPRDFGAVHLDRSFAANRQRLDPLLGGDVLKIRQKAVLARIVQPITDHPPVEAVLQREVGPDLVNSLTLRWGADQSHDALSRMALPLWSAFGKGQLATLEDNNGGALALNWENTTTRIRLLLPNGELAPELVVAEVRGKEAVAARVEAAAKLDREDRAARLEAHKPLTRLARSLQVNPPSSNGLQFDGLRLGMSRKEALATLPGSQTLRRRPLPSGLGLLFLSDPPAGATYWARQMFLRFTPDDKLAEVRVRYQENPSLPGTRTPGLFDTLKRAAGAPEELPAPWAGLWTDVGPSRRRPALYRWQDDLTLLTLQRDEGGAEVALRDRPADQPQGVELPPLQFCPRGVPLCALGDVRSDVLKKHNVRQPPTANNGAELLAEPATSPYDVLLVWYDKGRVSRIIARHRARDSLQAAAVSTALQTAWSQNIDHLGYVRRVEEQRGQVHGAYDWHDDVTRVRTFAQDTEDGIRLFTEFRDWPIASQAVVARPPSANPVP
jgi:hypothetical protein